MEVTFMRCKTPITPEIRCKRALRRLEHRRREVIADEKMFYPLETAEQHKIMSDIDAKFNAERAKIKNADHSNPSFGTRVLEFLGII